MYNSSQSLYTSFASTWSADRINCPAEERLRLFSAGHRSSSDGQLLVSDEHVDMYKLEMEARDVWQDARVQLFYISIGELIVNVNFDYESGAHDIQWLILIQSNHIDHWSLKLIIYKSIDDRVLTLKSNQIAIHWQWTWSNQSSRTSLKARRLTIQRRSQSQMATPYTCHQSQSVCLTIRCSGHEWRMSDMQSIGVSPSSMLNKISLPIKHWSKFARTLSASLRPFSLILSPSKEWKKSYLWTSTGLIKIDCMGMQELHRR